MLQRWSAWLATPTTAAAAGEPQDPPAQRELPDPARCMRRLYEEMQGVVTEGPNRSHLGEALDGHALGQVSDLVALMGGYAGDPVQACIDTMLNCVDSDTGNLHVDRLQGGPHHKWFLKMTEGALEALADAVEARIHEPVNILSMPTLGTPRDAARLARAVSKAGLGRHIRASMAGDYVDRMELDFRGHRRLESLTMEGRTWQPFLLVHTDNGVRTRFLSCARTPGTIHLGLREGGTIAANVERLDAAPLDRMGSLMPASMERPGILDYEAEYEIFDALHRDEATFDHTFTWGRGIDVVFLMAVNRHAKECGGRLTEVTGVVHPGAPLVGLGLGLPALQRLNACCGGHDTFDFRMALPAGATLNLFGDWSRSRVFFQSDIALRVDNRPPAGRAMFCCEPPHLNPQLGAVLPPGEVVDWIYAPARVDPLQKIFDGLARGKLDSWSELADSYECDRSPAMIVETRLLIHLLADYVENAKVRSCVLIPRYGDVFFQASWLDDVTADSDWFVRRLGELRLSDEQKKEILDFMPACSPQTFVLREQVRAVFGLAGVDATARATG